MKNDKGECLLVLYNHVEGSPATSIGAIYMNSEIKNGKASYTIKDILSGTHAITILHDENGNKKMDTNFLGIPKEGYVVSNNVRRSLIGPPKYEEAKFSHSGNSSLKIKMAY